MREYKKTSILTIIFTATEVLFEIVLLLTMSNLIDFGIQEGSLRIVLKYGVFLILFMVTDVVSAHMAAKSATGFAANLRQDMYDKVQTFSFTNIDKFSTSSIVTRSTTDITNLQNSYQTGIKIAIRSPFMIIFSMIILFSMQML